MSQHSTKILLVTKLISYSCSLMPYVMMVGNVCTYVVDILCMLTDFLMMVGNVCTYVQ